MQKLDKCQTKNYGPLIMWANDLEDLFEELENCESFSFVADNVEFDSVDEFLASSRGKRPSSVEIKTFGPYSTIELQPKWAKLYVSSSQFQASGLFHNAGSILSQCERKPKFFYKFWTTLVSIIITPSIFYLLPFELYGYLQLLGFVLPLLWALYVAFIYFWRFSIIWPMHREIKPSFFQRNFDGIAVAVIAALITAAIIAVLKNVEEVSIMPAPMAPQVEQLTEESHSS